MEIKGGNVLIVECQGAHRCGGNIRVPFSPPIGGAPEPAPTRSGLVWKRESGESVETITLSPSIDAGECGHFCVKNGAIV